MDDNSSNEYLRQIQAQRIRECMRACNLTGKMVAEKLNYTPQHISLILNGKRNLTVDMAIKLADLFTMHLPIRECAYYPERLLLSYNPKSIDIKKGEEVIHVKSQDKVDYKYLLGERDFMYEVDNLSPPVEQTCDSKFHEGLKALLHSNGYDLNADICFVSDIDSMHYGILAGYPPYEKITGELISLRTGEKIDISHGDTYLLYKDIHAAIMCIIERYCQRRKIEDALHNQNNPLYMLNHPPKRNTDN